MKITLTPDIFSHNIFQTSFLEKLKSCRYHDYNPKHLSLSPEQKKHYEYGRAVKGVIAEFAFYGYLVQNNIDFQYNKKIDPSYKWSTDIDFILSNNIRIDVKSGFSYFKPEQLTKNKIDYIAVCTPVLNDLPGIYYKDNYTLITSYRRLFKLPIQVDIFGLLRVTDILSIELELRKNYRDYLLSLDTLSYVSSGNPSCRP
jgi:hypothetical protein